MSYQRRKLLKALRKRGIVVDREGARHTIVARADGTVAAVPRHTQINRVTAKSIAQQFEIDWKTFEREIT